MDWTHAPTEIDGMIDRLLEDQEHQVQLGKAATAVERRAHVVAEQCEQRFRDTADEIERLERERA